MAALVAREGARARDVDNVARVMLRIKNLERYFTHRLGHGKSSSFLSCIDEEFDLVILRDWSGRS
jgi:Xaa-Pro aminopeptidase